jgi:hypothetical protein
MSNEGTRTIFFPLPIELLGALKAITGQAEKADQEG